MKKTKVALTAISIVIPANIIADTTLYGTFHNSLDVVEVGSTTKNIALSNNKSRLGVRGSEKISDEMSAIYQAEFGVDVGGGSSSTLTNRDQFVGLKTSIGTIKAGRMSTPFKKVGREADLFWSSQLGQNRNLTRSNRSIRTGVSVGLDDMDGRFNSSISYSTPDMSGFKATVAYVTEDQNDNTGLYSGNVFYNYGGLTVGAGYEKRKDISIAGTTFVGSTAYRAMAAYATGPVKVTGFYQKANNQGFNEGFDSSVVGLGAALKTVQGTVKAQVYQASDLSRPSGDDDNGATMLAIGYDHELSKRTTVYAQYAQIKNDSNGGYGLGLGAGGHSESITTQIDSSGNAQDQSGISIGLRHDF